MSNGFKLDSTVPLYTAVIYMYTTLQLRPTVFTAIASFTVRLFVIRVINCGLQNTHE